MYANIVVDYRPQKIDPNRFRITSGRKLINYPGGLTTRTSYLTTSKILWNRIISTINTKYMCGDIKILPLHPIRLIVIHTHTPVSVPGTYHTAVQFKREGTECIRLCGDQTIHLRPPTRRLTHKKIPESKLCTTWIF